MVFSPRFKTVKNKNSIPRVMSHIYAYSFTKNIVNISTYFKWYTFLILFVRLTQVLHEAYVV